MNIDLEVEVPSGELVATTRVNRKAPTVRGALKAAGSETCGVTNSNRI